MRGYLKDVGECAESKATYPGVLFYLREGVERRTEGLFDSSAFTTTSTLPTRTSSSFGTDGESRPTVKRRRGTGELEQSEREVNESSQDTVGPS